MRWADVPLRITFALLLGAALYVHAATASVGASYQQGMPLFRSVTSPYLVIFVGVGIPLAGALAASNARGWSRTSQALARVAILTSLVGLLAFVVIEWVEPCTALAPSARDLSSTLGYSLLCPRLSNRSYAAPIYSAVLAWVLLRIATWRATSATDGGA